MREGEGQGEAIAVGQTLVGGAVREAAHEADALAAGLQFGDRGGSRGFAGVGMRKRIEGRSVVLDDKDYLPSAGGGALDGNGLVCLSAVAVTNDVGERFLKTKLDGELGFG